MISVQRQQVALPLSQLSNAFHSLKSLINSAATSSLQRLQKYFPAERKPSLQTASVRLTELGLSDLKSTPLEELVSRLLPTLRAKEPRHIPAALRTTHVSADTFFQNKHGFSIRTFGLFASPTFCRQYQRPPCPVCSELQSFPVWIQHRGFTTLLSSRIRRLDSSRDGPVDIHARTFMRRRFMKEGKAPETQSLDQVLKQKNIPDSQQDGFKTGFIEGFLKSQDLSRTQTRRFRLLLLALLLFFGIYSLDNIKIISVDYEANTQIPLVTFDHVKGVDEAKNELQDVVDYLRNPQKFTALGGKLPKGILLVGPPGTGKTLLARAVAGEAGVPFHYASGSEFDEVYVGLGARRIRKLFKKAKAQSPCVIFIDELDSVGGKRVDSPAEPSYSRQTINQLLAEMDGFIPNEGIFVIGATNMAEILDKALVRPGRFDVQVTVPIPDVRGRTDILNWYLSKVIVDPEVNAQIIARGTVGFSGAELENLVNQAALKAAADNGLAVTMKDLEFAMDKVLMGPERKSVRIDKKNKTITAYHESGHAIVALYTKDATPVRKATIVPRGQSLGHVSRLPKDDRWHLTRAQLLADMDVCMGGRVAEELIFGEDNVTTGASSDFDGATQIAEMMVTRVGMSDKLGVMTYANPSRQSPERQAAIEQEVSTLLKDSYERAKSLLKTHSKEHKILAEALLTYETLDIKQIQSVLKGKL